MLRNRIKKRLRGSGREDGAGRQGPEMSFSNLSDEDSGDENGWQTVDQVREDTDRKPEQVRPQELTASWKPSDQEIFEQQLEILSEQLISVTTENNDLKGSEVLREGKGVA